MNPFYHLVILAAMPFEASSALAGDEVACLTGPELAGLIFGCIFGTVVIVGLVAASLWFFKKWLYDRKQKAAQPELGFSSSSPLNFSTADGSGPLPKQGCGSANCCKRQKLLVGAANPSQDVASSPITRASKKTNATQAAQNERWRRSAGSLTNTIHEHVKVPLKSHDFAGLGFSICGNMRDGIFVKEILGRGPAKDSGKLKPGDRIVNLKVCFENIVFEDALTILSYASPYEVEVELRKCSEVKVSRGARRSDLGPLGSIGSRVRKPQFHPLVRSQSLEEALNTYQRSSLSSSCSGDGVEDRRDTRRSKSYAVSELGLPPRMGSKRDSDDVSSPVTGSLRRMSRSAIDLAEEPEPEPEEEDTVDSSAMKMDKLFLNATILKRCEELAPVPLSEFSDTKPEQAPSMVLAEVVIETNRETNDVGNQQRLMFTESSTLTKLEAAKVPESETTEILVMTSPTVPGIERTSATTSENQHSLSKCRNPVKAAVIDDPCDPVLSDADKTTSLSADTSGNNALCFSSSNGTSNDALNTSLSISSFEDSDDLLDNDLNLAAAQEKLKAHKELLNNPASAADKSQRTTLLEEKKEVVIEKKPIQKQPPPVAPKTSGTAQAKPITNGTRLPMKSAIPKVAEQSGRINNPDDEVIYKIKPTQIRRVSIDTNRSSATGLAQSGYNSNLRRQASKSPVPLSRQSSASSVVSQSAKAGAPAAARNQDSSFNENQHDIASKHSSPSSEQLQNLEVQKERLFKKSSTSAAIPKPAVSSNYRKLSTGSMRNSVESLNSISNPGKSNGTNSSLLAPRHFRATPVLNGGSSSNNNLPSTYSSITSGGALVDAKQFNNNAAKDGKKKQTATNPTAVAATASTYRSQPVSVCSSSNEESAKCNTENTNSINIVTSQAQKPFVVENMVNGNDDARKSMPAIVFDSREISSKKSTEKNTSQALPKRDSGYGTLSTTKVLTSSMDCAIIKANGATAVNGKHPTTTKGSDAPGNGSPGSCRANIDSQQYQKLLYYQQQLAKQHEELAKLGVQVPTVQNENNLTTPKV